MVYKILKGPGLGGSGGGGRAAHRRIELRAAEVRAHDLVLCGNVYLATRPRRSPPKSYRSDAHRRDGAVGAQGAREALANTPVCDMNWVLDTTALRGSRLVVRRPGQPFGFGSFDGTAATREAHVAVFPQLADARIDYSWGGYVDAR